jgi:hypothetical protein
MTGDGSTRDTATSTMGSYPSGMDSSTQNTMDPVHTPTGSTSWSGDSSTSRTGDTWDGSYSAPSDSTSRDW